MSEKKRTNPLQWLLYYTVLYGVRLYLSVLYGMRVHGSRNVPKDGPVLLVANHQSYLDPPMVSTGILFRQTQFLARAGLFKNKLFALWISALNAVPVSEDDADTAAIKEILRRLKGEKMVLIFPEGSRTYDGAMTEFKRGVAVLLKRAKCPTVPVAIEGAYDAWPRTRKSPKIIGTKLEVKFGEPIAYDDLMGDGPDAALTRLAKQIDEMRLELRSTLRERSGGRFPPPGPGDDPAQNASNSTDA